MAKQKPEPIRGTWPTVRLTVSPELLAAIEDRRQAGETIQTRINIILAEACGMVPQIRPRGNPIGAPKRVTPADPVETPDDGLTPRQRANQERKQQIFKLVGQGTPFDEVARIVGCTEDFVRRVLPK